MGENAPNSALASFPPTIMLLSGIDPLRDDGLHFFSRLLENQVSARAYIMKLMPHGFLSYNMKIGGMPQSGKCVDLAI